MKLLATGEKSKSRIHGFYSNFQVLYPIFPEYSVLHYTLKGLYLLYLEGVIEDIEGFHWDNLCVSFENVTICLHGGASVIIKKGRVKIDYGPYSSVMCSEMSNENVEQFLREELAIKEQK
jgi:hypothetical protein